MKVLKPNISKYNLRYFLAQVECFRLKLDAEIKNEAETHPELRDRWYALCDAKDSLGSAALRTKRAFNNIA